MSGLDVERVLAAHRIERDVFSPYCACGQWRDKRDDGTKHRAHVAAAVRAEVRAWLESEAKVMSGIGSHRDPCRIPDTECLCGLCDFRAEARTALAALAEQVGQVAPSRVPGEGS